MTAEEQVILATDPRDGKAFLFCQRLGPGGPYHPVFTPEPAFLASWVASAIPGAGAMKLEGFPVAKAERPACASWEPAEGASLVRPDPGRELWGSVALAEFGGAPWLVRRLRALEGAAGGWLLMFRVPRAGHGADWGVLAAGASNRRERQLCKFASKKDAKTWASRDLPSGSLAAPLAAGAEAVRWEALADSWEIPVVGSGGDCLLSWRDGAETFSVQKLKRRADPE